MVSASNVLGNLYSNEFSEVSKKVWVFFAYLTGETSLNVDAEIGAQSDTDDLRDENDECINEGTEAVYLEEDQEKEKEVVEAEDQDGKQDVEEGEEEKEGTEGTEDLEEGEEEEKEEHTDTD